MRIHHLNCGTLCPLATRIITGGERRLVCHCLLVETSVGLVLVDTGFGLEDIARPRRLGLMYRLLGPALDSRETALSQIRQLGFDPKDLRHIVLTHLDLDHAGGLGDFPWAEVHLMATEKEAAFARRGGPLGRMRYRPAQWSHGPKWHLYSAEGEPWFGFECVRDLRGLPPEILLVPLVGHSLGHAGVAICGDVEHAAHSTLTPARASTSAPRGSAAPGWLLHAGDAYFYRGEVDPENPRSMALLHGFQRAIAADPLAWASNQARLLALARERRGEARIFCSHDARELEEMLGGTGK